MKKRIFVPTGKTTVKRWIWTRSKGLQVEYPDGFKCKSGWTLKELLNAKFGHGDGLPCREISED